MRRLVLRPHARQDIRRAGDWYETEQPGLGKQFRRAVEDCFDQIQDNPLMFRGIDRDIRSAHVKRFPSVVYFTAAEDELVVIACLHGHRDPRAHISRQERAE